MVARPFALTGDDELSRELRSFVWRSRNECDPRKNSFSSSTRSGRFERASSEKDNGTDRVNNSSLEGLITSPQVGRNNFDEGNRATDTRGDKRFGESSDSKRSDKSKGAGSGKGSDKGKGGGKGKGKGKGSGKDKDDDDYDY